LGLKVLPWTINDADTMRSQIAAGVDGIITDYPVTLRTVMAELGMPLPPAFHR
jgi:glycerophosphoryl diester phosphodiesterase